MTPGLVAADVGGRVDFDRLRQDRRQRVFDLMEAESFDAVVLGREANARYAAGLQRLPLAGSRPFAPSAVLVRASRDAHLLSGWDYTVPAGTAAEDCFAARWDPEAIVPALRTIDGLSSARRVGVDFVSPQWRDRLAMICPRAAFVDVTPALRAVRMVKTDDEVACVRAAMSVAEAALGSNLAAVQPGRRERELIGAFVHRMGELGLTVTSAETTCSVIDPGLASGFRRIASERVIAHGDRVAVSGGVLFAGYEGAVGRTATGRARTMPRRHEGDDLAERWRELWSRLESVLRPGASGDDLRRAYLSSGVDLPPFPIVLSVGLGIEAPIAGSALGAKFDAQWTLRSGMVLQVQGLVPGRGGGYFALETVLVTEGGPEMLSTLPHTTTW